MLVTSISFFFHSVFYSIKKRNNHCGKLRSSANAFNVVMCMTLLFGKGLKMAEMVEFNLDRAENIVRGEKWSQAFSSFPHWFEKAAFPGSLRPGIVRWKGLWKFNDGKTMMMKVVLYTLVL